VVPVLPDRGPDGRGRAQTYAWREDVRELTPDELADERFDAVLLQRPHEADLLEAWTGLRAGRDLPAVYVEHNAPQGRIADMRHPVAGRDDVLLVHVTHFNDLFWNCGTTPTRVVEHGVVDPGPRYTGELERTVVVINNPVRRGRVTGTDLLPRFRRTVPVDLFGMRSGPLGGRDVSQAALHREMARRRVYIHPVRWTSLGLSLIEAMHLGMPVVALATTEVYEAVPREAGVVSNRLEVLESAMRRLTADIDEARARGSAARAAAVERFGLGRFLEDWDGVLEEAAA